MATDDTNTREALLNRVGEMLVCPECRGKLTENGPIFACRTCARKAKRHPDHWDFGGFSQSDEKQDWLNTIKWHAKKRLGKLYPLAMHVLSPVYGSSGVKEFIAGFDLHHEIVCDLGAGTRSYDDKVVCIDGYPYPTVHVVTDLSALPFEDGAISGIISEAVLEHVPDPKVHVAEMWRVLKPGGRVLCYFPFIVGFHASPHDYSRLTQQGLRHLFSQFEINNIAVGGGPTSGLLWTLQEWLAMVGSLGSERAYRALVPITWLLSPLKYLDVLLIHHPAAHVIASGFAVVATKSHAKET